MDNSSYYLLTTKDILTLSGAVMAVYVITQAISYAFDLTARYLGLIISFLVGLIGAMISNYTELTQWFLIIPNSCMIFCSASGIAAMGERVSNKKKRNGSDQNPPTNNQITIEENTKKHFFQKWF